MDKETLSNYGWIVILVLILAVLLALATPFGNFIADGFKAAYIGFFQTGENALGIVIPGSDNEEIDTNTQTFVPGLYQTGTITKYQSGEDVSALLITPWDELVSNDVIHVDNGIVYTNVDIYSGANSSSDTLAGDLLMPTDGTIKRLGNFDMENLTGNMGFAMCTKLTGVLIPQSVKNVDGYAFYNCSSLSNVDIPNQVTVIGEGAFAYCASLTNIVIPDSVETIEAAAFNSCANLKTVYFGTESRLKIIGDNAFAESPQFESISIPDNVEQINRMAFYRCNNLQTVNISPNSKLTTIGDASFSTTNLTSIFIPNSVTVIGTNAFYYCYNLSSVTFGTNSELTTISLQAFGFASITNITLPKSLTYIGDIAFQDCPLSNISYVGTISEWNNITKHTSWKNGLPATVVHCSDGDVTL